MRNPPNDTLAVERAPRPVKAGGDEPERRCILSGDRAPSAGLVRLALGPDGSVLPDVRAKAPGRGAWIGVDRAELEAACAKGRLRGALARAFKGNDFTLPDDLADRIEQALERNAMDRLGLESRGGGLLTGSDKIDGAARGGKLIALYHAEDAAADGARKLAQAWRVGSDQEGSGRMGVTLPLSRPILSQALGRENVVHIGLIDAGTAKRVDEALSRWLHFIGRHPFPSPCESASQGPSAVTSSLPISDDDQGTRHSV